MPKTWVCFLTYKIKSFPESTLLYLLGLDSPLQLLTALNNIFFKLSPLPVFQYLCICTFSQHLFFFKWHYAFAHKFFSFPLSSLLIFLLLLLHLALQVQFNLGKSSCLFYFIHHHQPKSFWNQNLFSIILLFFGDDIWKGKQTVAGHRIELQFIANICLCIVTLWDLCRLFIYKNQNSERCLFCQTSLDAELTVQVINRKFKCQVHIDYSYYMQL